MKQLVLTALFATVCGTGVGTNTPVAQAKPQSLAITSVLLSRGYVNGNAKGIVKAFKPTDLRFHCVVELNRVATVTARGVWYAVDTAGAKNFKIVEASLPKQLADQLHFSTALPRPWPTGKYRVDIYINNKKMRSVPFNVVR